MSNWAILLKLEGERLEAQGDLVGAKAKFEERLHIIQKLVKSEPSNPGWGSDLSISYYRLGRVLQAQGDLNAARIRVPAQLQIGHQLREIEAVFDAGPGELGLRNVGNGHGRRHQQRLALGRRDHDLRKIRRLRKLVGG